MYPTGSQDHPPPSFDPTDWAAFENLARRLVAVLVEHWRSRGEGPAWRPVPAAVEEALEGAPLPREGIGEEDACRAFVEKILPYGTGADDPRFWGWALGGGTPLGALGAFLGAGLHANCGGLEQAATRVERTTLRWLMEALGWPGARQPGARQPHDRQPDDRQPGGEPADGGGEEPSGLFVSGAATANLLGLAVALNARAGFDVRRRGLQGDRPRLTVLGARGSHASILRALEVLGLGADAFRALPTRPDGAVDATAVEPALADERAAGRRPFALVATAGTVETGAIDDLAMLAGIARREGLWLHVDGAFGALAALSLRLRPRLAGLEEADSLAFDLHKGGQMPFGTAVLLVRRGTEHRRAFRQTAPYLEPLDGGPASPGAPNFADLGVELTRPFRALPVWLALQAWGVESWAREMERSVELARRLAATVESEPRLRLGLQPPLNVVLLRHTWPEEGLAEQNRRNREILRRLQADGVAVPSGLTRHGRFWLRLALLNHRTRWRHLEDFLEEVLRRGESPENPPA